MDFTSAVQRARAAWQDWTDFRHARVIQERLARCVQLTPYTRNFRYVLAVDCAFLKRPSRIIAGAIIWDRDRDRVVTRSVVLQPLTVPYVPGFLSFRELPAILDALQAIDHRVDWIMVDGQGIAHPRRFGLAAHLGVLLDWPTVGVGKSRLYGVHPEPGPMAGAFAPLWDPKDGTMLGCVIRTRDAVRPIIASPGHKVDILSATRLVLACVKKYRLPEPQRWADRLVRDVRNGGMGL